MPQSSPQEIPGPSLELPGPSKQDFKEACDHSPHRTCVKLPAMQTRAGMTVSINLRVLLWVSVEEEPYFGLSRNIAQSSCILRPILSAAHITRAPKRP